MSEPTFCDWDGNPAVLFSGGHAWFVGGGPGSWSDHWSEVNGAEIGNEGRVMGKQEWEGRFSGALARAGAWPEPPPDPTFTDWDGVPAVLFPGGDAWFVPGGPGDWAKSWREVSGAQIGYEGRVLSWDEFRTGYGGALTAAGRWPEPPRFTPEQLKVVYDRALTEAFLRERSRPWPEPQGTILDASRWPQGRRSTVRSGRIEQVRRCYGPCAPWRAKTQAGRP